MHIEYVIRCSVCKKLKTLENYGCKYRIINDVRVLVKNKICKDCLMSVKDSYSTFKERYGMTYYSYRLNKS